MNNIKQWLNLDIALLIVSFIFIQTSVKAMEKTSFEDRRDAAMSEFLSQLGRQLGEKHEQEKSEQVEALKKTEILQQIDREINTLGDIKFLQKLAFLVQEMREDINEKFEKYNAVLRGIATKISKINTALAKQQ